MALILDRLLSSSGALLTPILAPAAPTAQIAFGTIEGMPQPPTHLENS